MSIQQDVQSSSLQGGTSLLSGLAHNPVLQLMRQRRIPLTKENYLEWADDPEEAVLELLSSLPSSSVIELEKLLDSTLHSQGLNASVRHQFAATGASS